MPDYVVKQGAKAFLDGSVREGGYVYRSERAMEKYPTWAEPQVIKASVKAKAAPKAPAKPKEEEAPVSFSDVDLLQNPTVQLS